MILTTNILFYFLLFSYSFFFIQGKMIMSNGHSDFSDQWMDFCSESAVLFHPNLV